MLTDKTVLITGGKRIGAVIAAELAAQGMDVALSYNRSKEEAEQTAAVVAEASDDERSFCTPTFPGRAIARPS